MPKTARKQLAKPGDPLVLGNGTVIQEDKPPPLPINVPSVSSHITPETFRPSKRRSIKELPADPSIFNGIAAVFVYTMLGLSNREIAEILKIDIDDVLEVKKHSAYTECFDSILNEFLSANSDLLQSRIAAYSNFALDRVVHFAQNAVKEDVGLKASQDILDRANARPQDNLAKRASVGDELKIVFVKGEKKINVSIETGSDEEL